MFYDIDQFSSGIWIRKFFLYKASQKIDSFQRAMRELRTSSTFCLREEKQRMSFLSISGGTSGP